MDERKQIRTEITIEKISVTTIKMRGITLRQTYCSQCGRFSQPFDNIQTASILSSETRTIDEMCRDGQIHRLGDGGFCGHSLAAQLGNNAREPDQLTGTISEIQNDNKADNQ